MTMGFFDKLKNVDPEVVDPEVVDPEVVDPEVVDPEVVDPEVVDPEVVDPAEQLTTANSRLHTALVALDGRLANPDDLPFDPVHLEDEAALESAISSLIESRPGLKKNHVAGDVGQGARGNNKRGADLIELMKMA